MIGRYKAYPEYKESGVEWIKKIPSSWFISDLRRGIDFLTDFEANGSFSDVKKNVDLDSEDKYAWYLRATDLQNGRIGLTTGNRTVDEKAYQFLKKTALDGGELLVAKRGEIGKVYLVPELNCKATLAPNLYLIRLNQRLNPRFSLYWFLSSFGKPQLELANKSTTIGALYKDDVRACQTLYPTIEEQQKIASFLDHETAKIDTLITKQQKLIELLKEKRQAVISHAVTKGLNPDAPMKDSGVEWLGEVPEHWDVAPLKFVSTYNDDSLSETTDKDYQIEYIDIGSVSAVNGVEKTEIFTFANAPSRARRKLQAGDVIVSTVRTYLEAIAVIDSENNNLVASTGFCVVRPTKVKDNFAGFALRTRFFIAEVISRSTGISYPAINSSDLVNIKIAYPREQEQEDINQFVKNQCLIFDSLTEKATNAISLMKERKTALISAAVTGKVDVRDWSPA